MPLTIDRQKFYEHLSAIALRLSMLSGFIQLLVLTHSQYFQPKS